LLRAYPPFERASVVTGVDTLQSVDVALCSVEPVLSCYSKLWERDESSPIAPAHRIHHAVD
jgi:hypothetical protein